MLEEERIDKWLWAMRVFKTRTLATDACKKGRVLMDNVAVKPSRNIRVGDRIDVKKPPVTYSFRVKALSNGRLGAKSVPDYLLNETPQTQYDILEMSKISGFVDRQRGLGRPTKRDSRRMAQFKEDLTEDFYLDFEDE